ncbi:type VI immunity family protein [Variovorax sp. 770b2]|uniref:type VI immunity family protein n=1 Tax=Variovorax sp. 770b2 TaxID=1566271 RepID=UPI0008E229C2|nr:type VI immunity family protein [Variovorax sp. 770b2]SFQ38717.1 Protein of unknown function [Variovorax sp. 770b2]
MSNHTYPQRLKRLEPYAELWRDDKKFVEHKAGLYATFYFKHTHSTRQSTQSTRQALVECWNDYWSVVGIEHWRWVYGFKNGSVPSYRVPTEKVPKIENYMGDSERANAYQYYASGGKHDDDASEYMFHVLATYVDPEFAFELATLRLQAPLAFVTNGDLPKFIALVKRCATRLKANQAYGGLGFLRTYNEESTTCRTEAQLAKVFSGTDIDIPHRLALQLANGWDGLKGISGAHWLNFLDDDWVTRLGGLEHLRSQLPEDLFKVEACPGGVFIQAGAYPEPGHKDDGLPPRYVWLNRVLKPIRLPAMQYHMGDTPGQLALPEDALSYFTRFDAASDALGSESNQAAKGSDLSVAPRHQTSAATGRVEGGQPCPQSGWWFTPAKVKSRRYFKAGELMPAIDGSDYGSTFWQWDLDQSAPKL